MGDGIARRAAGGVAWRASALVRVLPDFLVIGAQKAGTTSSYEALCRSPAVLPARKKEVRYFSHHPARSTLWYRWSFPTRFEIARRRGRAVTGEASPDYLVHPLAPERVARTLPGVKLIVLLRHPVDRLHSQYRMNLALGVEHRQLLEAVEDELARLERRPEGDVRWDDERNFHSYVERSRYRPQLERWFAHHPRDAFHVTSLEAILRDPDRELAAMTDFLGIEPLRAPSGFVHANRRRYDDLPPEVRRSLFELFADDVRETEDLLGTALGYGPDPVG